MEEDMYDVNFIADYDPSSGSQSEDWIVIDEPMSENGEAHQKEEERSPKDIPEARTVKLTEPAVRPPVVPDVKTPDPQLVSRVSCSDTHSTHTGKYHCPICNIDLHGHVKRHVLRSHLPWFWIGPQGRTAVL